MFPVALDIESGLIRPGLQAPPLVCVALANATGKTLLPWYAYEKETEALLRDNDALIIGHNIAFDMADIASETPRFLPLIFAAYDADRIACTQVRQKLLDIAGGVYRRFEDVDGETQKLSYSLADLSNRHLGTKIDKEACARCGVKFPADIPVRECAACGQPNWRLRFGDFREANLPVEAWPEGARAYVLNDADMAARVWAVQEPNAGFLLDQYRQTRAAFWLRLMMNWGIRTDAAGVVAFAEKAQHSYDAIAEDLRAAGLLRPDRTVKRRSGAIETEKGSRNAKLAGELITAAYARIGKECPTTEGGKPQTGKVACEESGDLLLMKYAELSSLTKVIGTDVPLLEGGISQPIHSYYDELAESGRTKSAKPNLQNLPRIPGVRECFVPSCLTCGDVHNRAARRARKCLVCGQPLTVFIGCDYGGLELCTLAQACKTILGYSTLGDALNAGKDPHLIFAGNIRRESYDALYYVKKKKLPKDSTLQIDPSGQWYWNGTIWTKLPTKHEVDDARQTGKVGNFGFPGGLGPASLVFFALNNYSVRITEDEARELKKLWLGTWSEMQSFFNWVASHTNKGWAQIKQLFVDRYRGGVKFCDACNTIFQGLGADIAKAAGWDIAKACYLDTASPLFGCRIVLFVHDEFVLLCPETRAHEAAHELRRLMLQAARPFLPDVNIDAEPVAMRRYSKEAEQVWIDGRLIPWSPSNDLDEAA